MGRSTLRWRVIGFCFHPTLLLHDMIISHPHSPALDMAGHAPMPAPVRVPSAPWGWLVGVGVDMCHATTSNNWLQSMAPGPLMCPPHTSQLPQAGQAIMIFHQISQPWAFRGRGRLTGVVTLHPFISVSMKVLHCLTSTL